MIRNFIRQSWFALAAMAIFGMSLAAVDGQLKEKIEGNAQDKLNNQMRLLLPEAKTFNKKSSRDAQGVEYVYYAGSDAAGQTVGYVFEARGSGFADVIVLLVAADASMSTLKGLAILQTNETPGFGDKMKEDDFKGQFLDCPIGEKLTVAKTGDRTVKDREIVAISGATISSEAVVKAVNEAIERMRGVVGK